MTKIVNIQTNFTVGEVDPLLRGRIDLNQYYSALKAAENVVIIPQGGARRRPGLKFIYDLPATAANGVALIPFEFSTADSYMFAVVNQRIYIFKNGAIITNINGSGNPYLAASTLTSAILPNLKYAQSADTMIFVHEDLAPLKLVRGATDSSWTLSTISFSYIPQYAFTITTTNPTSTLTPSASTGFIELTAAGGVFSSGNVEQYVNIKEGYGYGRARIVTYVSSTKVKAQVEIPFSQTSAYGSGEWELESGYEHTWSATKVGRVALHSMKVVCSSAVQRQGHRPSGAAVSVMYSTSTSKPVWMMTQSKQRSMSINSMQSLTSILAAICKSLPLVLSSMSLKD